MHVTPPEVEVKVETVRVWNRLIKLNPDRINKQILFKQLEEAKPGDFCMRVNEILQEAKMFNS